MELVAFETGDRLRTDGLFVPPRGKFTVVHVHGKCGNFYQNDFIKSMLSIFEQAGIGFLTFNNRGHDCIAEGYRNGRVEYVGGSVERFMDCLNDISAAVAFARDYADHVIVQGHSNGAEKALQYALVQPDTIDGIVLLSPSDSYEMQRLYRPQETPEDQARRLSAAGGAGENMHLLPKDEYGIRTGDKEYSIPVTKESLLDLLTGPAFNVLRLSRPWTAAPVAMPTLVCLAEHDPYLTVDPNLMKTEVQRRLGDDVTLELVMGADHHFHGREESLVRAITKWALALKAAWNPESSGVPHAG
jgi:pimeloyl-ACP methyl ester carboxylesterase